MGQKTLAQQKTPTIRQKPKQKKKIIKPIITIILVSFFKND